MDWISILVGAICSLVGAFGGGSILYFRQNKKLKEMEVVHTQSDEWQELYNDLKEEKKRLNCKVDELYKERNSMIEEKQQLQLKVQQLCWYRCEVEHCQKRKPPHVYSAQGDEMSATQS